MSSAGSQESYQQRATKGLKNTCKNICNSQNESFMNLFPIHIFPSPFSLSLLPFPLPLPFLLLLSPRSHPQEGAAGSPCLWGRPGWAQRLCQPQGCPEPLRMGCFPSAWIFSAVLWRLSTQPPLCSRSFQGQTLRSSEPPHPAGDKVELTALYCF